MAYKNLITTLLKTTQVFEVYSAPTAVIPTSFNPVTQTYNPVSTLYCFLSRVDPWPDENDPPAPTQDQRYLKSVYKNIFATKLITSNNICPVVPRIDWTSGVVYNYYRDDIDMFALGNFYVKNRYDQIWKCLWNNKGQPATVEPVFQPGSYGTNNIYTGSDGYKWHYMSTIDVGTKRTFMDKDWMPVFIGATTSTLNPLASSEGIGGVEVINVISGNTTSYTPSINVYSVNITGDGTGAAATVEITGNVLTDIIVTRAGSNYSYANVTISTSYNANTVVVANSNCFVSPASPIGGHSNDLLSELGCKNVMVTCEFDGSENGIVPTDIEYRQVGLLANPISYTSIRNPGGLPMLNVPASGSIYSAANNITVSPGFGAFVSDETVIQKANTVNPSQVTFSATVLDFNRTTNILTAINTQGQAVLNSPLTGLTSGTSRTFLTNPTVDYISASGYILYIENVTGIQRSPDGKEQFKFVLGY